MPKELEDKLRRQAAERGYGGERTQRYIYGTLARLKKEGKIK